MAKLHSWLKPVVAYSLSGQENDISHASCHVRRVCAMPASSMCLRWGCSQLFWCSAALCATRLCTLLEEVGRQA